MFHIIGSSKARVRSMSAVNSVIDSYLLNVLIKSEQDIGTDTGTIAILGDYENDSTLTAAKKASVAEENWTLDDGDEGFDAFLLEIAPLLETPLTIFIAEVELDDEDGWSVLELRSVQPGATQVEERSFDTSTIEGTS